MLPGRDRSHAGGLGIALIVLLVGVFIGVPAVVARVRRSRRRRAREERDRRVSIADAEAAQDAPAFAADAVKTDAAALYWSTRSRSSADRR